MKTKKAISWEKLSEGTLTAAEIKALQEKRTPIAMSLSHLNGIQTATVQIVAVRGPAYNVISSTSALARVNRRPYKYLSCAVRCAVKQYKAILRTGNYRCLTKV